MHRRQFLTAACSAAALSTLSRSSSAATPLQGKADHVISIWLGGGMGAVDTFDPKRRGDAAKKLAGSYYDSIETAVPGVLVCEHLKTLRTLDGSSHRRANA